MQRLSQVVLVLVLLAAAGTGATFGEDLDALDFTATALDGTPFSGQSLAGKAVLLDFWGSWCAPCIHAFPTLRRLHAEFGDSLQVVGLAYYSGELSEIAAVAAEHQLDYTVLEGSDATIEKFGILAFPSYVLIASTGEVLFTRAGQVNDLYEQVAQALGKPLG